MRKELFYKIAQDMSFHHQGSLVIKDTEEFICYVWCEHDNSEELIRYKEYIKENGWKPSKEMAEAYDAGFSLKGIRLKNVCSDFISVFYTKATEKISIKKTEIGIGYSYTKQRFYPLCKNTPLLCLNKKLYMFRGRNPRLYKASGNYNNVNLIERATSTILNLQNNISAFIPIPLNYEGMCNGSSIQALMEKATGVKIPKILCKMNMYSLYSFITCMRNPNELNTLAQHLSKGEFKAEDWEESEVPELLMDYYATKCPDQKIEIYLVRDWLWDMKKLGLKNFSLSITSQTRIADEHIKMSREIRKMQLQPIKVQQKYIDFFEKNEEFKRMGAELITTKERLLDEGTMQDHCVASYGGKINSGDCAIISFIYNDKRYTLELNYHRDSKRGEYFYIGQLQGYRNCRHEPLPTEFRDAVQDAIDLYNPQNITSVGIVSIEDNMEPLF